MAADGPSDRAPRPLATSFTTRSASGSDMSESARPSVTVVIPNFNGRGFLQGCLSSLAQASYPSERLEVLLVDNASSDGSREYVDANFPWVEVLELDRNYGFSAVNRGVRASRGEVVVLLNNDTRVDPDWLRELADAAAARGSDHVFTSKTLRLGEPHTVDYAGGVVPLNGRGYSPLQGRPDTQARSIRPTGYPCAVSLWVHQDTYWELGGFDADYFACHDDVDFGLRAWLLGREVYLVPTSVVYHAGSGTVGGRESHFSVFHHTKNALQNILKNFEARNAAAGVLVEVMFDGYQAVRFLKRGNREGLRALKDAYQWVVQNLEAVLAKRRALQARRMVADRVFRELDLAAGLWESLQAYRRLSS